MTLCKAISTACGFALQPLRSELERENAGLRSELKRESGGLTVLDASAWLAGSLAGR